jgi:uncharacterized protein YjiS (DUF1127 family)
MPTCPASPPAQPSGAALEAFVQGLVDRSRRRRAIRELRELGDHRLRDIGIEPGQIEAIADDMVKRLRERS